MKILQNLHKIKFHKRKKKIKDKAAIFCILLVSLYLLLYFPRASQVQFVKWHSEISAKRFHLHRGKRIISDHGNKQEHYNDLLLLRTVTHVCASVLFLNPLSLPSAVSGTGRIQGWILRRASKSVPLWRIIKLGGRKWKGGAIRHERVDWKSCDLCNAEAFQAQRVKTSTEIAS